MFGTSKGLVTSGGVWGAPFHTDPHMVSGRLGYAHFGGVECMQISAQLVTQKRSKKCF